MYNAKMWLLVKPSVGLPLFFGSVAVTSLIVHAAILTHTSWYPAYYEGNYKPKHAVAAAAATAAAPVVAAAAEAPAAGAVVNVGGASAGGAPSVVINVGSATK